MKNEIKNYYKKKKKKTTKYNLFYKNKFKFFLIMFFL